MFNYLFKRTQRKVGLWASRYYQQCNQALCRRFFPLPVIDLETLLAKEICIPAPILDDIDLPPYVGELRHDDYHPLMGIAMTMQPKIVVELGTAHGNAVANICQACPATYIYTVNAPAEEQTGDMVTYWLTRNEIGRVYRKYGYAARVQQIFKNTRALDLADYLQQQPIDLAIIDACHDTDYVINDFLKVLPFMSAKGIMLLHDTHPSMREHLAGSYLACLRLRQKGHRIGYLQGTWWGIWAGREAFLAIP